MTQLQNDLETFRGELPKGWTLREIYHRDLNTSHAVVSKTTGDVEMSVEIWRNHGVPHSRLVGHPTQQDLKELETCRVVLEQFSKSRQY